MNVNIYKYDIELVKQLDVKYPDLTMNNTVSQLHRQSFIDIKDRLMGIADYFKGRYDSSFGLFQSDRATGNPVGRGGNLRRVWAGIFKGSENKQYSAQISFVVNTRDNCLDVGFYFGRASSHKLGKNEKQKLESQLKEIGKLLYSEIAENKMLREKYYELFDYGFKAEYRDQKISSEAWLQNLNEDPAYSSLTFSLYPTTNGLIDFTALDLYVAMVMPFMAVIPENINTVNNRKNPIKPLTPEQRAKQAELRALIGLHGEEYVMIYEKGRLDKMNIVNNLPIHKALVSDSFGYNILSCNEVMQSLYIEVKTTTLLKSNNFAKHFYMSESEYNFYQQNKTMYRLYRVYDIYGSPEVEIINLEDVIPKVSTYKICIP